MHSQQHLLSAAQNAHNGTSFSPEKRGANLISEFQAELNADLARIPEGARAKYAASYERYLSAWIGSKSRCVSSMIAGPANFPVRRMEKYNNWERAAYDRLQDYRRRAMKAILKAERAPVTVQSELDQARKQLSQREALQAQMKRINDAYRKYSKAPEKFDFTEYSDAERQRIAGFVPKYSFEKAPYRTWELSNNNAQIKRYCDRVKELEEKEAKQQEQSQHEALSGEGWRIVENFEADRLQIIFDEKPAEELRTILKRNGFKWAPSANAWQRKLTGNARWDTKQFILPNLIQA